MTEEIKMIIANNIKFLRNLKNESSVELAEAIGVSQSTVSDWENGNKMPRAGSIEKLAQHFEVNKTDILTSRNDNAMVRNIAAHAENRQTELTNEDVEKIIDYIDFIIDKKRKK